MRDAVQGDNQPHVSGQKHLVSLAFQSQWNFTHFYTFTHSTYLRAYLKGILLPLLFVGILSLFRGCIDLASDPLLSQIDLPHLFIHYPPPHLPQAHWVILCHWGKVSSDSCPDETSSAEVSFLMQAVINKLAACFCCPQVDMNVSVLFESRKNSCIFIILLRFCCDYLNKPHWSWF